MKPEHYNLNIKGMECNVNDILEAVKDKLVKNEQQVDLMVWNYYCQAVKYILRNFFKGQQESDLKKAITEIQFILNKLLDK